jgi:hypothetical protein
MSSHTQRPLLRAEVTAPPIGSIPASRHLAYAMLTSPEVSLGNTMSEGEAEAWKALIPA